jgi:hypothetical protein
MIPITPWRNALQAVDDAHPAMDDPDYPMA